MWKPLQHGVGISYLICKCKRTRDHKDHIPWHRLLLRLKHENREKGAAKESTMSFVYYLPHRLKCEESSSNREQLARWKQFWSIDDLSWTGKDEQLKLILALMKTLKFSQKKNGFSNLQRGNNPQSLRYETAYSHN